jgi:hypothetical protein
MLPVRGGNPGVHGRDHLDFGIVTDQGQIPDAWPFIAHLHTALEELQTVLHRAGRTVKRRQSPTPRSDPAARA